MHRILFYHSKHINIMSIKNKIGVPVTGEDFFGRVQELSRANRYLDEGQSLLLSAPRRIGKSSLAKKLIANKTSQQWKCIYIDLQGTATKEEFLRTLINSFTGVGLMEKTSRKVKDLISSAFNATDGVELGMLKIDLNHKDQSTSLYRRLADTFDYEHDTLIVIDELPLFLGKLMNQEGENRDDVEYLLNWFRSIRQNEKSHLRWLFCGSVGLRNFTNHHRMSQSINDLIDFELGELPKDEAYGLIKALACSYDINIDDNVVTETLELMQWSIPYFLQLLMDRIISKVQSGADRNIDMNDIEQAVDELATSDYLMTWDERLDEYQDLEIYARVILNALSTAEAGLTKGQLLQLTMNGKESTEQHQVNMQLTKVLDMLEHDGYIIRKESNRKFRSPLLRKWWKYKFMD